MVMFNRHFDSALETEQGAAYSDLLSRLADEGPIFGTDDQNETVIIEF